MTNFCLRVECRRAESFSARFESYRFRWLLFYFATSLLLRGGRNPRLMSARSQSEFCMDFCFSTMGIFRFSRWSRADRVLRFVEVCKLLLVGCVCAVVAAIKLQEQIRIAAAIGHSMVWYVV